MDMLITGGCGFMGYHLAKFFAQKGHSVTCLDNFSKRSAELVSKELVGHAVNVVEGDVANLNDYSYLETPDVILHLAAQTSAVPGIQRPNLDFRSNLKGTFNVLEFARQRKSKVIFWSSNKVYPASQLTSIPRKETHLRYIWDASSVDVNTEVGKQAWNIAHSGVPESLSLNGGSRSIYGLTKACADLMCQEWAATYKIPTIVNRFSCVAGTDQYGQEEQGWLSWFCAANLLDLPVNLVGWKGKQVRDVLNVKDVCILIEKEIERIDSLSGEVFNIGGGIGNTLSLLEALSVIERLTGRKFNTKTIPEPRIGDQCIYISDIRKARRFLHWAPTVSVRETIEEIVDWTSRNLKNLRAIYGV